MLVCSHGLVGYCSRTRNITRVGEDDIVSPPGWEGGRSQSFPPDPISPPSSPVIMAVVLEAEQLCNCLSIALQRWPSRRGVPPLRPLQINSLFLSPKTDAGGGWKLSCY